jgi:eukaryotic-like serine/threonine-protein kinase
MKPRHRSDLDWSGNGRPANRMSAITRLVQSWIHSPQRPTLLAPPPRPEALPAGTLLGDARIERLVARGSGAALYAAVDAATATPLAVKVLCPPAGEGAAQASAEAYARFLQEGEHAMRLLHPGIVRVYGGGCIQGLAFIVMELLPGADLTRYTRAPRLLPEPLALEIAARLAEALAYAHREGVVHRDVKPANVMFDPATGIVKLTDFGLARSVDAEATRSGVLLGSPAYMAPELLAGARADARSDFYALGVLLFELLTGRLPFVGDSMGALLRAMATQPPQTVHAARPDLPAALAAAIDGVLAEVLAREPHERHSDGEAWARALRDIGRSVF